MDEEDPPARPDLVDAGRERPRRPRFKPGDRDPKTGRLLPGNSVSAAFGRLGGGRPAPLDLRDQARGHASATMDRLAAEVLAQKPGRMSASAVRAAELILAYGYGRPRQAIEISRGDEGAPPVRIDAISMQLMAMLAGPPVPVPAPEASAPAETEAGSGEDEHDPGEADPDLAAAGG